MWFSIGFAAACAAGAYLTGGIWLLIAAGVSCLGAGFCCFLGRKKAGLLILSVLLAGCCAGLLWFWGYERFYISPLGQYDETTAFMTMELTDYPAETDYGYTADARVTLSGRVYRVLVYLDSGADLSPGDLVRGEFQLRFTARGGAGESTYLQGDGTFLKAYASDGVSAIFMEDHSLRYFPARLRRSVTRILESAFPEDTRGFSVALLLGDTSGIDYVTDTALKISGIRHIIAVSGLHVSILFAFAYHLVGKRSVMTTLIGIPLLFLFAAVAGFSPSILRATVMQTLMILAMLLDREYDPPTALSFAVLVMLGVNPFGILSVSLQLSAGCMIGILLFSKRISGFLLQEKRLGTGKGKSLKAKFARGLAGSLSVSVSTMAVTAPLCGVYFDTLSVIGVLTNFLTLWAVSLIFYGVILTAMIGAIFLPLAKALAWVVSWLIRYVLGIARLMSAVPMAALYTQSIYVILWVVFAYVLLGLFFLCGRKRAGLFTLCLLGSMLLAQGTSWAESKLENYRVTILDVGQGQCVLLQSRGSSYLVDCGGNTDEKAADAAAQALLAQGIRKLDGAILTHYDADHAGGLALLLTRVSAKSLYLPDVADAGNIRQELSQLEKQEIQWISESTVLMGETFCISLFPGEKGGNENESSMCVLFQAGNCDILITGDRNSKGERYLLEQAQLPEIEILIAGHHGASSSTGMELLTAIRPQCVVISVGERNAYGHPGSDLLRRLELFGCAVYRTDELGTIVFRG